MRSSTVHSKSESQGTVENMSLLADGVAFDILLCWKDDHLQTSEYSQQGKYKGEVTNTTENDLATIPTLNTVQYIVKYPMYTNTIHTLL